MKYLALAAALFALSFTCSAANPPSSDAAAIRSTVSDYIEGYYTADAARFQSSLHPHYLKHTISDSEGHLRMTEKTGLQMIEDVRSGEITRPSDRKEEITVFDVTGDIASAKLITEHWVDYITLSKWNGQWKIVSVVLREND